MARLMRRVVVIALVVIGLLAAACSSAPTVDEQAEVAVAEEAGAETVLDTPAIDLDLSAELGDGLDEWAENAEGGAVAYVRSATGQVEVLAAGDDPQTKAPLDSSDRVRVGSISKVYTAVLVLQLVDDGLVDLDAPISTYLGGLGLANDVTVRQLLGHRTGIPNYTDTRGFFEVVIANPERKPAPIDLVNFTNGDSDFEPDAQFAYSNTNFIIAGMLIENRTNKTLAEVLVERVATPLGLTETAFADGTIVDVAGGYSGLVPSGNSFDQDYTSIAYGSWAAGGLVTTVEELAQFLDAALTGDLLSVSSQQAMSATILLGGEYGLGLHAGPDFGVGHGGSIIGFNSIAELDIATGEMIVVVVNNDMRSPEVISARLAAVIRSDG